MGRILLCLGNAETRRELAERLAPQHECLDGSPQRCLESLAFDVAVIDAAGYRAHPELLRCRGGAQGQRPPLLLVASEAGSSEEPSALSYEVDEVIVSPIRPQELSMRLARLLHAPGARMPPGKAHAMEVALGKAEARLAEMQALARAGYFEIDVQTGAIWWSKELFRLFGREPREGPVTFPEFLALVDPEDRAKLSASYQDVLERRRFPTGEFRALVHGELRTFLGSARLHEGGAQGQGSVQGVLVDISEARWRMLKEAVSGEMTELVVRDQPVREFVERGLSNFGRLFPDLACATVFWDDPSAPNVFTRPGISDELRRFLERATLCDSLLPAAGDSVAAAVIEDIEQNPRCASVRSQARAHGLRSCWYVPLISTEPRVFGCFLVYSPRRGQPPSEELALSLRAARLTSIVVERSRSTAKLRESEARLRALFDHAPLGMCLADGEGRAIHANRTIFGIVGVRRGLSSTQWADYIHPDDRQRALECWRRLSQGEISTIDITYRMISASGEVRTVRALANPVHEGASQREFVVTIEDVTERLRMEDQLRQAQKMEAIGRLAGGIAHDFNNMLTVILNGLTLLEPSVAPAEQGLIKQLLDAGERASALTRQLLAFSRRVPIRRKTEDLRVIVRGVSGLLESLLSPGTKLQIELGTREALAYVNASMIEQVLMNLVINARDAMPHGGTIRLRLEGWVEADPARSQGGTSTETFHHIAVGDTGTGIAKEDLPRIFEPFYTTKAEGQGTGLGLATVYDVVQQHGGWVDVESELGQGSTFHVYLPSAGDPNRAST